MPLTSKFFSLIAIIGAVCIGLGAYQIIHGSITLPASITNIINRHQRVDVNVNVTATPKLRKSKK
jgi:hypothetical protein